MKKKKTITEYIWIGGTSYTAVAVAKIVNGGTPVVYAIFRDHLGTITHLKSSSETLEYSFDAYGRRRDKDTWSYTIDDTNDLFADRGFTGHEYLEEFNLYNMNGRLYDPLVGRFLSPDNYVQAPDFTQSFNRYGYCLNNPLSNTDPSGEYALIDDLSAMAVGGVINLGVNLLQGKIHSWGEAGGYFLSGAAAAEVTLYAGPVAGGFVMGMGNDLTSQLGQKSRGEINSINWSQATMSGIVGGVTAWAGGKVTNLVTPYVSNWTSNISSPILQNVAIQSTTNATSGFVVGTGASLLQGNDFKTALGDGGQGALFGFGMGTISGTVTGIKYANEKRLNPLTGEKVDLKFASGAQKANNDPNRYVSADKLENTIDEGFMSSDPQGSKANAYYSRQQINGKTYNVKVIYNTRTNTVYHYHYQSKPFYNIDGSLILGKP